MHKEWTCQKEITMEFYDSWIIAGLDTKKTPDSEERPATEAIKQHYRLIKALKMILKSKRKADCAVTMV